MLLRNEKMKHVLVAVTNSNKREIPMLQKLILTTVLVVTMGAVSAHAEDYSSRTGTTDDFTGPYVGGTIGYGWGDFDADVTVGGTTVASSDPDMDGLQGGFFGGYGFQFDPMFASQVWDGFMGLEAGYEWSNADGSVFGGDVDKDETMIFTLRPGLTWGDTALGYGIVGYSRTQFEAGTEEEWVDGLVLGIGTELYTIGPFKTRIEYQYTNYEDTNYTSGATALNVDGHENALKLGAVFRF